MRTLLTMVLATCGLLLAPISGPPVSAEPMNCPPNCDRIPDSAWIEPSALPLYPVYRWPELAGLATTVTNPRFKFEEACATPSAPDDARSYAVASRAVVVQPEGQWQLQVQIVHWRGETWRGGQLTAATFDAAVAALRACQVSAPLSSPSLTTDTKDRMAAVVSGVLPGQRVLHQYLIAHIRSSTLVEVAMWASTPPRVDWPAVPDTQVLDAMTTPLCTAYVDSCR